MIGERLRKTRTDQGLSLRELAARSGVSTGAISLYERNIRVPSVVALARLEHAMGLPAGTIAHECLQ